MGLFIFWLPIIGSLLLGSIAVGAWFADQKLIAIWFGFAGSVCFLLIFTIQIQQRIIISPGPLKDRAQISIDTIGVSGINWVENGGLFAVQFKLTNTGKENATHVFFEAKTWMPTKIGEDATPQSAMRAYVDDIERRRRGVMPAGKIYYVGQSYQEGMAMLIDRNDAESAMKALPGMNDVLPRVIACVSYSIDGTSNYRHSCNSFFIFTPAPPRSPIGIFRGIAVDRNYPAHRVGISQAGYTIAN
jgi:hypothetical protein